jgi:hypothetical protein
LLASTLSGELEFVVQVQNGMVDDKFVFVFWVDNINVITCLSWRAPALPLGIQASITAAIGKQHSFPVESCSSDFSESCKKRSLPDSSCLSNEWH